MKRTRRTQRAFKGNYQQLESRNLLATITVDTLSDSSGLDGLISLREAIIATSTNAAHLDAPAGDANGDQIVFSRSLFGQTISLEAGPLAITDDLVIRGGGVTIEAAQDQRIFNVESSENVTLANLQLTNGNSAEGGAIRFSGGGTLRLFQLDVFDNTTSTDGGAVYAAGGTLAVYGVDFQSNTATAGDGGAIFLADESATAIILTSTFDQNEAFSQGGAIYSGDTDQVFIFADTQFTYNSSGEDFFDRERFRVGSGGAIFAAGNLRIGASSFVGNSSDELSGGAIASRGPRLTIANTIFEDNTAAISGGAVIANETIVVLNTVNFRGNSARGSAPIDFQFGEGGALAVYNRAATGLEPRNSGLTIRNSSFQANTATDSGGAIYTTVDNLLISDSFIGGNTAFGARFEATQGGGGLFISSGGSKTIFRTTFQNNFARASSGGAIFDRRSDNLEIIESTFTLNRSEQVGGAVSANGENVLLFKSDFDRNRALGTLQNAVAGVFDNGAGGAVQASGDLVIAGGTFQDNVADQRGGALLVSGDVTIRSALGLNGTPQFTGNRALQEDGGAIFSRAELTIRDAVFSDGESRNGAGIFAESGSLSLIGSEITDNAARQRGGGLFVSRNVTFFQNSFFDDNTVLFGDPDIDIQV